jgi:L-2-hydroxyglutarate oxidase LhgO
MGFDYDVAVVGAGVAGCCCARELARYDLATVVLEAGLDIACGATRANSGIVHAGYDPTPGTLKAHYNVEGARLMPEWAQELGFSYIRNGAYIVAFSEDDACTIDELADRARANGVTGVSVITGAEARAAEPSLSDEVVAALDVPMSAICDPYGVAFAAAENAAENGVAFRFGARVATVEKRGEEGKADVGFRVTCEDGSVFTVRTVVNAAGVFADELNNQVSAHTLRIVPRRGEYCLYDTNRASAFKRTIFQPPTDAGKGVLVSPTVHGNLFCGPTSVPQQDKSAPDTTEEGLAYVIEQAKRTWPEASGRDVITNFAGLRASGESGDFVIGQPDDAPGFFNIACLESPGLTSAPAIAVDIAGQVAARLGAQKRADFNPHRAALKPFAQMSDEERAESVRRDPAMGRLVCRCRNVTEGELVSALHGPLPPLTLDALKWRTGATMGRCHGGFCTPEILKIASRELDIEPTAFVKSRAGSYLIASARPDYRALVSEGEPVAGAGVGAAAHAQAELSAAANSAKEEHASGEETAVHSRENAVVAGSCPGDATAPAAADATAPYDVVVVGGGAAGMAAATRARVAGAERVVLIDREAHLGGIMKQCIHNGFGLSRFGQELTGPQFVWKEQRALDLRGAKVRAGMSVLRIDAAAHPGEPHTVACVDDTGLHLVRTWAVVLATGSRERGAGAIGMAGSRPSGVFTAGEAQNLMNLQGCLPGTRAVVLGSGDIGLIMARRMTLAGMQVEGVYELMPTPSGLKRNIVQCLQDFDIPLHLSRTVVRLEGERRLEAVWIAHVDPATRRPIPDTAVRVPCDTLVLSVGLLPENEVAKSAGVELDRLTGGPVVDDRFETNVPGVFSCGNALHIHDLADYAAAEGDEAGSAAAQYVVAAKAAARAAAAKSGAGAEPAGSVPEAAATAGAAALGTETQRDSDRGVPIVAGEGIRYTVPQFVSFAEPSERSLSIAFRVSRDIERPRFSVEVVDEEGNATEVSARSGVVAVPAEMRHLRVDRTDLGNCAALRVSVKEGK